MEVVAAGLIVAFGALVQGTVGFGIALVAAPLLAILNPALVPVPVLLLAAAHALLTLAREFRATDWRGVALAMIGRVPGAALGTLAVTLLPDREFSILVALTVLTCAGMSVLRCRLRPTAPILLAAGLVSGASGTASSIGGPPIALVYQHETGPRVRSTLGAYFALGAVLSLLFLGAAGQVHVAGLLDGALMLPFMVGGFLLSNPVRHVLDRGWTRPAVVALAVLSALGLLAKALLT
ncbi:sulfite exporter TauE/SafE family protein [Pseudonocardia asaccharolytica]|uniref:Probable membrane transporter protein n=1 Tax=Pseudonocardia asaccharolytica DSM 44247 = NBRC 16224 TaxID=1123024 RepID=A0A511CVS3_9PSEU|nr:sulfite exporter TauE/SafE family protein [Pseudonocardia asaccharolytica]GEL16676.1 permease [Pseudonocardia asaccharolytica DSM 44247 = NBRC 16224]